MKKKLLAGLMCLLMVFTMVPGVFAAASEASTILPIISSDSFIDDCPECRNTTAFFYISNGAVLYFCPRCQVNGVLYENPTPCACGNDCVCMTKCECGRSVMCGDVCTKCYTYNVCGKNCLTCEYPDECECGENCKCLVLCDCKRIVYCGMKCPNCSGYTYCEKDCGTCEKTNPDCKCDCGNDCECPVKCTCGRYVFCGETCRNCQKKVSCGKYCSFCPVDDPFWNFNCGCGKDCDCPAKCSKCGDAGYCGDYCRDCKAYMDCGTDCKYCGWSYGDKCICGTDCDCIVPCVTCLRVEATFCGEKCGSCGKTLYCYKNCGTCSYTTPTYYKVSVSKTFGGTYQLTNGLYGKKGEVKTLTITPNRGYVVSEVMINGVSYGDTKTFELPMDCSYSISIHFAKVGYVRQYLIQTTVTGMGTIEAAKNGKLSENTEVLTAVHSDTVNYSFIPAENYSIRDVKINGESVGAVPSYSLSNITTDTIIEVVFAWKNPYTDIKAGYLSAIEYVTSKNLMSSYYTYSMKHLFKGDAKISAKTLITTLAESADVKNELNTADERMKWAVDNGIIAADTTISSTITMQGAAEIIAKFLEAIEKKFSVTFTADKAEYSAKETCIALNIMTEEAYTANTTLSRYDLADLLYKISKAAYTKVEAAATEAAE